MIADINPKAHECPGCGNPTGGHFICPFCNYPEDSDDDSGYDLYEGIDLDEEQSEEH